MRPEFLTRVFGQEDSPAVTLARARICINTGDCEKKLQTVTNLSSTHNVQEEETELVFGAIHVICKEASHQVYQSRPLTIRRVGTHVKEASIPVKPLAASWLPTTRVAVTCGRKNCTETTQHVHKLTTLALEWKIQRQGMHCGCGFDTSTATLCLFFAVLAHGAWNA